MIVFMGVAGSGKSVQGKMLADKIDYRWMSTGELLRSNITDARRDEMLQGKLLDDQEIIKLMNRELKTLGNRVILDGFPRTIAQAEWLIDRHNEGALSIELAIHIEASKEAVKNRLLQRGRQDDNEEAINQRFKEYEELTLPIVKRFKQNGVNVSPINGENSIDEVHNNILTAVGGILR
jgi:adenylate kinase